MDRAQTAQADNANFYFFYSNALLFFDNTPRGAVSSSASR